MALSELINEVNNLNKCNSLNELILSFNRLIVNEVKYSESILYFFNEEKSNVTSFKFLNNSLYRKQIDLSITNTLFEKCFLEQKTITNPELGMLDYFKKESYFKQQIIDVISIPLLIGDKCIGTYEFKFKTNQKVKINDLEKLIRIITIKIYDLVNYDKDVRSNNYLKSILNEEQIVFFTVLNDFVEIEDNYLFLIKNIKKQIKLNKLEAKFKVEEETYYSHILKDKDVYYGYVKNISEITKFKEQNPNDTYYDLKNQVYSRNFLIHLLEEKEASHAVFSLIKFRFSDYYSKDVLNILKTKFDVISFVGESYICYFDEVDKRKLNPIINELELKFNDVLGLDIQIGILRYGKDINDSTMIFEMLDIVTKSESIYYSKKNLQSYFASLQKDLEYRRQVNNRHVEVYVKLIMNYYKEPVGYLVNSEYDDYYFKDIRFNLILLDEVLKKVLKLVKPDGIVYYIEIDSNLVDKFDILDFFETRVNKAGVIKENIGFKLKNFKNTPNILSFIDKAIRTGYKVASDNIVKELFQEDISLSAIFIELKYNEFSNYYVELLKEITREKYIDFIFVLKSKDDFIRFQRFDIGYAIAPRRFNIKKL